MSFTGCYDAVHYINRWLQYLRNVELQELTTRLVNSAGALGMELNKDKCKVMVNSRNNATISIQIEGQQLEEVGAFKYLGATMTKDGRSTTEIKARIAIATSSMAKLNKLWNSKSISFEIKIKLYKSLILSILLYGCESWTLTAETTRRVQAFEMKCYRRMLGITWKDRKTNEFVRNQVTSRAGGPAARLARHPSKGGV